jgi:hypothetical protein
MLSATFDVRVRGSRNRMTVFLERGFRGHLFWREHLVFDSRYMNRAPWPVSGAGHLYVVLEGQATITGGGGTSDGPVAFLMTDEEFDVVDPSRPRTLRVTGARVRALHLRIPAASLRRTPGLAQGPLDLDAGALAAVAALLPPAPAEPSTEGEPDLGAMGALLDELARLGVVEGGLAGGIVAEEPKRLQRIWRAARPYFNGFAVATSLKILAAALPFTTRHATRDVAEFGRTFYAEGDGENLGLRAATLLMRLRSATLWLGAPDVTATEVARLVGYKTLTALGTAFREAGLPAPSEVRDALRGVRPAGGRPAGFERAAFAL